MTQDSQPLVTIVTPSYNQAAFLPAAVESVLSQDYPKIEYIVLDAGSTDGSVEFLKRFDGRLSWESGPDRGQADALAKGFARARGSILGWLNADDVLFPRAISEAVARLAADPKLGLVYGDAVYIDTEGNRLMPCRHVRPFDLRRLRYWSDYIVQPSAFFRRSAYEAVGGIDRSLHWSMDYDLWLKLGRDHGVAYMPRLWSGYRMQNAGKTVNGGFARLAEVEALARRHGLGGLPADFRIEKAALHLREARQALASGGAMKAASALLAGVATIVTSWRALLRCCSWPLWRDTLRNRAALRRARAVADDGRRLGRLL
ncbi:MAG TPA: glycosyltransferase family 2 protein [Stellaceae bacterium]